MNSPDLNRPGWHRDAACRGLDPELFFPNVGHAAKEAKAVCRTCPVKEPCYEAGREEYFGVWGGTTRKERQMAELGHLTGRVPTRGCRLCGMPTDTRHRYCSDECRAKARQASNLKWRQSREVAS